jgi:hypothetical protein
VVSKKPWGVSPLRSRWRSVSVWVAASRTTVSGVRTVTAPPLATTAPVNTPSAVPTRVSAVTVARAWPPAGTVTRCGLTASRPAAAGAPSGPAAETARSRVTSAAPKLW